MAYLASRSEFITVRGLRYHLRQWGDARAPQLFLLHGWMDCSPTFQFVVQALSRDWHVLAPDWRGYGLSSWLARPYWFPDYFADLDCLLHHYSPSTPVRLVGHSMGGSIAAMYAGLRPARVAQLVVLDFLGLKPPPLDQDAAVTLLAWLDAVTDPPRLRSYKDAAQLARRLMAVNPRLTSERATFLAAQVSRQRPDGLLEMACDPWHKIPAPYPYRAEDAMDCWRRIAAPVLQVLAQQGYVAQRFGAVPLELERRLNCFRNLRCEWVADAGHNLQHDQPGLVAALLEDFLVP